MLSLLKFLFKFSPRIVFLAIFTGIVSGMSSAALIGVINSAISMGEGERLTIFFAFLGLAGVMLIAGIVSKISLILLAQSAVFELRMSLSRQIIAAPLGFLESYGSPRILASLIDDVQVLAGTLLGIPALCINLATVIICLLYIGWLSPWVLGAVILFTIIGVVSYYTLLKAAWNYLREAREIQNNLFGNFRALTQGTKELKLHKERRLSFFANDLQDNATAYRKFSTKGSQIYAGADSWGQFLFIILIGLILFVLPTITAVSSVLLTGYILALLYIMAPLEVLINFFPNINRAQVSLEQIKSLGLTLSEEKVEKKETYYGEDAEFETLELIDTKYRYKTAVDEKPFEVGPTNLKINKGDVIFVVGGNGSGKTTLMKLITGLYLPSKGEIKLNGKTLDTETLEWYRANFSAVFSDFYLFDKLLGLESDLIDKAATSYLKKLHLSEKVNIENGVLSTTDLSQGQRKRLALLASFLEDRNFYVFDEWAADQDPVFKQIFYKELLPELKARGKTLFVITHDDRYYSLADRVIKLDYGKVTEISPDIYPPVEGMTTIKELAQTNTLSESVDLARLKDSVAEIAPLKKDKGFKYLIGGGLITSLVDQDEIAEEKTISSTSKWLQSAITLLLIGVFCWAGLSVLSSPDGNQTNIPPSGYSAERAFEHVAEISKKPHPTGSKENEEVRQYIVDNVKKLGLEPEILKGQTVEGFGDELKGGTTTNILVKIKGTDSKYKIVFSGHYDSMPHSTGAGDNGAAVGAMLEAIRTLKETKKLKNDIHFLFTDGEELTMLGARGIRDSTEYFKDVDLIFNFDARGSSGVSVMFETSPGNEWLIENLKKSGSDIVATSISQDIYRYMPNITDFTIYQENNLKGLNFAFIGDGKNYHNKMDTAGNLSLSTLMHHGNYIYNLALHFGNIKQIDTNQNNSIYFNLPGGIFVNYSNFWLPIQILIGTILLIVSIGLGFKKKMLNPKSLIWTVLTGIFFIIASIIITQLVLFVFQTLYLYLGGNFGDLSYKYVNQVIGTLFLTFGIGGILYRWAWHKTFWLNLYYGATIIIWIFLLLSYFFAPGGSYLFFWSLLAGLLTGLLFLSFGKASSYDWKIFTASWLFTIPTFLLFIPLIYLISVALGINSTIPVTFLSAIIILSMLPQIRSVSNFGSLAFTLILILSSLVFMILSIIPVGMDKDHPDQQHLFYTVNKDKGQAVWASGDKNVNDWSAQFLNNDQKKGKLTQYFPSNFRDFTYSEADIIELEAPQIEVVKETEDNDNRILTLTLKSNRNASAIYLFADSNNPIKKLSLGDEVIDLDKFPPRDGWDIRKLLTYYAIPVDGLKIEIESEKNKKIKLTLLDQTYGLPEKLIKDRTEIPENLMFSNIPYNNSTLISKSFEF